MKIPIIKKMCESMTLEELKSAENALMEGEEIDSRVEGVDEGEKLTHILASVFILERMAEGVEFNMALREYSQRVRNSIS